MRDEGASSFTDVVKVRDIELPDIGANAEDNLHPEMEPFEIYRDEYIRVTAILVEHQPVFPRIRLPLRHCRRSSSLL